MERPHPIRKMRGMAIGLISAVTEPSVLAPLSMTLTVIGFAAVFYHLVEGWALIDAAYFATVTIATVGYGDFVPTTTAGKLFTMVYVIVGIGLFVAAGAALADHVIRRAREEEKELRRRAHPARPRPQETSQDPDDPG